MHWGNTRIKHDNEKPNVKEKLGWGNTRIKEKAKLWKVMFRKKPSLGKRNIMEMIRLGKSVLLNLAFS